MSIEGEDWEQMDYNDELMDKMKLLLESTSIEEKNQGIQQLIDQLEKRNQRLDMTLQDHMSKQPNEMKAEIFSHLTEVEIVDVIMEYPQHAAIAAWVLKKRKCKLSTLNIQEEMCKKRFNFWMSGNLPKLNNRQICIKERLCHFNSKTELTEYIAKLLHVVTTSMDSSDAEITLLRRNRCCGAKERYCSNHESLPLEIYFGDPPPEPNMRIECLIISSKEFLPILKWITCDELIYEASAEDLIDLVSGCRAVTVGNKYAFEDESRIDKFMEICRFPVIKDEYQHIWTESSFFAVLSGHANFGGPTRRIFSGTISDYFTTGNEYHRTYNEWRELFNRWSVAHVDRFGTPKNDVTIECALTRIPYGFGQDVNQEFKLILTLH